MVGNSSIITELFNCLFYWWVLQFWSCTNPVLQNKYFVYPDCFHFFQVIFSSLTPFVPQQLNTKRITAKILVYNGWENNPAVFWKFDNILIISKTHPCSKKKGITKPIKMHYDQYKLNALMNPIILANPLKLSFPCINSILNY